MDPATIYRALSVRNGKHVGSFVKDFIGPFVRRERSAASRCSGRMCGRPSYQRQLDEMLRERDGAMKRAVRKSPAAGAHRHLRRSARVRRLPFARSRDTRAWGRARRCRGGGPPARRVPATSISDICTQHKFRLRFDRLCESMCHAVEYIGSNGIFGEPILLHGLFCLTVMQSNKGEKFDEPTKKDVFRFFNRLVRYHAAGPRMKSQQECASAKSYDRRQQQLDAATVVLQMEGRIGGWSRPNSSKSSPHTIWSGAGPLSERNSSRKSRATTTRANSASQKTAPTILTT